MKKKTAAKSPKAKVAKKKIPAKGPTGFFATGRRGPRGLDRKPFHVLLTTEEHAKLVKLTFVMKCNAADVVRSLIAGAKLRAA